MELTGVEKAKRQLSVLSMSRAERTKKNKLLAREVQKNSKKRIRTQTSLHGGPFEKRKGKSRKKMLKGLARRLIVDSDADKGVITYNNRLTGSIAKAHQEGIAQVMTASKAKQLNGSPDYEAPATRKQAKALRDAGYQIRRKGSKGLKTPSIKWITENILLGQAGAVLKALEDEDSKKRWTIDVPERPYLGVTKHETSAMTELLFSDFKRQIKRR